MAELFGRQVTRQEILNYCGNLSQVGGVRSLELADGAERGVRLAEFRSGSGLEFDVLLDRGLDIGAAHYRGIPLAWRSPAGFAHPAYYEPAGIGWLRTFGGGLVVGTGLTHLGSPEIDDGEALGLHGRLSHLPATKVQVGETWDGDDCRVWLQGELHQARVFGENLCLRRRISVALGTNTIHLDDEVENLADSPSPLMLLYHMNLGFPLLDEHCSLVAGSHAVTARDETAAAGLAEWMHFQPPTSGYAEQVYYHDIDADARGWAQISLLNPHLGVKFTVRYQKSTLPNLVEWKQMGRGAYVLGLEPANCRVEGRSLERARGTLQTIQPGERRTFAVEIEIAEIEKEG